MSFRLLFAALVCTPVALVAQLPAPRDTARSPGDTLTHAPATMQAITVTAGSTPRETPLNVIRITPAVIATTQATDNWDLLRQTAGVEIHEQGQGRDSRRMRRSAGFRPIIPPTSPSGSTASPSTSRSTATPRDTTTGAC